MAIFHSYVSLQQGITKTLLESRQEDNVCHEKNRQRKTNSRSMIHVHTIITS